MPNNPFYKITKVTINSGVGRQRSDAGFINDAVVDLAKITGQKPVITRSHKSIAGFKLRKGESVGIKVTLRGKRMADFLDRLIKISLPRLRDLRGLDVKGFDGRGNYNLGIREQIIFPEIKYLQANKLFGFEIAISTNAPTDREGYFILKEKGFPFVKDNQFESKVKEVQNG